VYEQASASSIQTYAKLFCPLKRIIFRSSLPTVFEVVEQSPFVNTQSYQQATMSNSFRGRDHAWIGTVPQCGDSPTTNAGALALRHSPYECAQHFREEKGTIGEE
jgi:hypothetical protein